jgi:phosphate transport system permease protein
MEELLAEGKKKKRRNKDFVFTKESLRKKFRLSEFLAEKIISTVAFLSIAVIVLIFIFVFKETLPVFKSGEQTKQNTEQQLNDQGQNGGILKQETYGAENSADPSTEPLKQETYGGAEPSSGETALKQEQYGVTTDSAETPPEPMMYDRRETTASSMASTHSENQAALRTLASRDWQPVSDRPRYGLLPLVLGTLKLTLIAILFAAPLAIMAALYSSTFAPKWARETIKPVIELLAGFPSVVIGFFALMVMATVFQDIFGYASRLNSFVGGIALSLAAIPIIYTITEDALNAIPKTYSEASLALGATKWQTAFNVVLPAATPGIFAAILLGIGRVFGETMIALMATGNAAMISANPFDSVRTLSATIGAEMAEVVFGDTHYSILFLIGSLLFIFTFALNFIAEFYIKGKLMKRFQGK